MPDIFSSQGANYSNGQINVASATSTEALCQGTHATAEVTHQGTQANLEAVRRAGETRNGAVRQATQAMVEGQRQIAQEATQRFQEVSRKVAQAIQGTSREMSRLAMLPQAAEGGLQDLQQSVAGLVEGAVHANLRAAQELFRLANPAPIVELQQRFARGYLEAVMQGTATVARAVRRTADETLHRLEAQIEQHQAAHQSHRTAAQ